jgi:5-methylcytosine-specific restriction endonuclease McrA
MKKAKKYNHKSMLRSAARKIWMWSPMRKEAIKNARVGNGCVGCASCGLKMKEAGVSVFDEKKQKTVKKKEYAVDHTIPASEPAASIHSWDNFYLRLFECPVSELKILCHQCHGVKTASENVERKSVRSRTRK